MTKNGRIRIRAILWLKQGGLCCYCERPKVMGEDEIQEAA